MNIKELLYAYLARDLVDIISTCTCTYLPKLNLFELHKSVFWSDKLFTR